MPIPDWIIPKPFRPGYTDTSKPMPGEAQWEYDIRRGLVNTVGAFGKLNQNFATQGPGGWGSQAYDYFNGSVTGPAAPPPQKAGVPKPTFASKSNNPASFVKPSPTPAVAQYPFSLPQGAVVTSGYRTPEHNKNVGGVSNSFHTRRDAQGRPLAVDIVPPKGVSMAQLFASAKQMNPHADVINEGDHVHLEPPAGGPNLQAFQQAAAATGLTTPPPGFNASGYNQADALLQQAQGAVMQPFSATYKEQPLPELPKPEQLQAPDYSAGDAAFAAATPKNPFGATPEEQAKGQLKLRRADYFAGIGQALASIDWSHGPGLGELFAKLGAGALMGAKAGDTEVQERMDKFDEAMQRYSLALAQRDDTKARDAANIANQNIQSMNGYKRDLWTTQVQEIQRTNPRVENGVLITQNKNPDGTTTMTQTPLDPARQTAALYARANNAIAKQNSENEYGYNMWRFNKEVAGAAFPYAMADAAGRGDYSSRDGIMAVGLSDAAITVTEAGRWQELYQKYIPNGSQVAADTQSAAYEAAGVEVDRKTGQPIGTVSKEQQESMQRYISSQLVTDFVNQNKTWALVGGPTSIAGKPTGRIRFPDAAVSASIANERARSRSVSQTTNARGQTSTTVRQ